MKIDANIRRSSRCHHERAERAADGVSPRRHLADRRRRLEPLLRAARARGVDAGAGRQRCGLSLDVGRGQQDGQGGSAVLVVVAFESIISLFSSSFLFETAFFGHYFRHLKLEILIYFFSIMSRQLLMIKEQINYICNFKYFFWIKSNKY